MEDGNLLILTEDLTSDTVEDMCILVDRQTGEILKTWDYKDFMPVGYGRSGSWTEEDWFHNNAVWYDKNTNSLTFSGRHVNSMVNIDFDSGKLNWVITDPAVFTDPEKEKCGWPQEFVDKYCFKPIGNNFGCSMNSTQTSSPRTATSCASTTITGAPEIRKNISRQKTTIRAAFVTASTPKT